MDNLKSELEREIARLKVERRAIRANEDRAYNAGLSQSREESAELTGWIDALQWVKEKLNESS